MCGIVGLLRHDQGPVDAVCVQEAAHCIRHRGPDGEGYLLVNTSTGQHSLRNGPDTPATIQHPPLGAPAKFVPDLVLGHRRLAILDLSPGGHEPMADRSQEIWVTFNGEVYNFLEVRDDLRVLGYEFYTGSDVEVLLAAYRQWGLDCLERLVGMFAFALWDQRQRRLWCVRDRLGIKPFYYVAQPERFAFASEIKALRILVPQVCQPDMAQLAWFLHYGLVYNAPLTFYEGISELPAGHYVLVENGKASPPIRWWNVDLERSRHIYDYKCAEDEFLRLMRNSVELHLRSDVPVGTCLSGGLDSSTIVALVTEQLTGRRMASFSAIYPAKGLDESRFVDLVSSHCNTIVHRVTPETEGFFERLQRITWHQDIPTASPGIYTQNFVMQLAQGNVTVLLDGQGADELFGGYLSHVVYYLSDLRRRKPLQWIQEQLTFVLGVWSRFNPALNAREFGQRVLHYLRSGRRPIHFLSPEAQQLAEERQQKQSPLHLDGADALNGFLYQALVRDSIPSLLHYEDRNSMAYGLEARVPFLDHRMVEFGLGVPANLKIRGPETKLIMRRALRNILPLEVSTRKDKLGYPTPFGQWLRGPLRAEADAYLNERVMKAAWLDAGRVSTLWHQHLAEERNAELILFRLITAQQWYDNVTSP